MASTCFGHFVVRGLFIVSGVHLGIYWSRYMSHTVHSSTDAHILEL